jgi:hypothetical protein
LAEVTAQDLRCVAPNTFVRPRRGSEHAHPVRREKSPDVQCVLGCQSVGVAEDLHAKCSGDLRDDSEQIDRGVVEQLNVELDPLARKG